MINISNFNYPWLGFSGACLGLVLVNILSFIEIFWLGKAIASINSIND